MKQSNIKKLIKEALQVKPFSDHNFEIFKKTFSKKYSIPFYKNADIREIYNQMVAAKEIEKNQSLEKLLKAKQIRTLSGVAVIAVLTQEYPCPGNCIFCPTEKAMPKSYLSNEPAVMRAIATEFDPYRQIQARIKVLALNGHATDKIELIVMGGTFSYLPENYQYWFIYQCFRACNDYPDNQTAPKFSDNLNLEELKKSLAKEKTRNEKATNRIVGLTLETRPDYITQAEAQKFRTLGATRVELGVQAIDDKILEINKRGHLSTQTIAATKILKNWGFKINYHLMPGLLGSSVEKDFAMFQTIYTDQRYQPDMVKIYPCTVTENSELYDIWKSGDYQPLTNEQNLKLMKKIKAITPCYIRITRLIRDIPSESIVAGPNITNLRQLLAQQGATCNCIRCREIRTNFDADKDYQMNRVDYRASDGTEIFLQFITSQNELLAMLRLRIPDEKNQNHPLSALQNAGLIRELHTYGKLEKIAHKSGQKPQHLGLGKRLLQEAEKITAQEFGINKIAIISGVGVREYYRKNGYKLQDEYMVKKLN